MTATRSRPPSPVAVPPPRGRTEGEGSRPIRPRRGLPGGRAVAGGLLVAVAAVGTFAAATGAGSPAGEPYVVAARDIAPGTVLTEADLAVTDLDLPSALRGRTFASPADVVGAVAVGPLAGGELVQSGALAPGDEGGVPTFSVSVPRASADGGELQRGDRVQVWATYGSDSAATTALLAADATIAAVSTGDDALGSGDQVEVRLAIGDAEERTKVLNAAVSGQIALVRTTGIDDVDALPRYRPDLDADTASSAEGGQAG